MFLGERRYDDIGNAKTGTGKVNTYSLPRVSITVGEIILAAYEVSAGLYAIRARHSNRFDVVIETSGFVVFDEKDRVLPRGTNHQRVDEAGHISGAALDIVS